MNKKIKARWVAALRSGEYKQGEHYLQRNDDNQSFYCCLGVLCDLAEKDGVVESYRRADDGVVVYEYETAENRRDPEWLTLPAAVQKWAGFDGGREGAIPNDIVQELNLTRGETLASLNDDAKFNFHQIADVIERAF